MAPYDELCEYVREETDAAGAVVIVFRGKYGSGYSVRSNPTIPAIATVLSTILRDMADQLDTDLANDARIVRKAVSG
jgi:hypothetical protein